MKFILFLLRNRKYDKPARVQKCNLTEQVNRFCKPVTSSVTTCWQTKPNTAPPMPQTKRLSPSANGNWIPYASKPMPGEFYVGTKISAVFFSPNMYLNIIPSCFIWTTSRLGWHRPDNPTGPTHLVRIILDKRFPYMDARSHCPMDRTDWKACQQRSSPTRQHPTGLPEIHILQKSDARQPVPLLFGWSGAYLTEQCHPQNVGNGTAKPRWIR